MGNAQQLTLDSAGQSKNLGYKNLQDRQTPELIFALVEPIGGGATQAQASLKRILEGPKFKYQVHEVPMSKLLEEEAAVLHLKEPALHPLLNELGPSISDQAKRINKLQQLGNELRKEKSYDYLAKKAIQRISDYREENDGFEKADENTAPVPTKLRVAHIIKSIKHKDELKLLKAVYGNLLILIGVSGNYEQHVFNYCSSTDVGPQQQRIEKEYQALSKIDQYEGIDHGQQVRKIFYKADLFLKSDEGSMERELISFLDLLFGMKIGSPTKDERMMFEAYAASLRSTCLSRQVGAAIADEDSELVSVGWNDIPSFGGGLAIGSNEALCKSKGECRSTVEINKLLTTIVNDLKAKGLLKKKASEKKTREALENAGISGLIEFSRAIHAEMEALLSAARTGKHGLKNGTIYVTTYPCENCAKHIIASGLRKVVYIEPYPKSRAKAFFSDFIADDLDGEPKNKLIFSQFTGVAPQAYSLLFRESFERKDDWGRSFTPPKEPMPIVSAFLDSYTLYESRIAVEVRNE